MEDMLFTVSEVAKIIKCNKSVVYNLINKGLLPCLILGHKKVRKVALENFLEKYEGMDLSDLDNIREAVR